MVNQLDRSLRLRVGSDPAGQNRLELVRIELLGGFDLRIDRRSIPLPLHVQRLLAFLALQSHPRQRAYVSGRLWRDLSQEHAFASLRTAIWRLGDVPCDVVEATSTQLALAPSVGVDSHEFEACAYAALLRVGPPARAELDCLVRAGDLLPDWYDDWLSDERERLRELRLLALEAAADELLGASCYAEATLAAVTAVRADPLRESSSRLLIRSYLAAGNLAAALHHFDSFRSRLMTDLNLEPTTKMLELVRGLF